MSTRYIHSGSGSARGAAGNNAGFEVDSDGNLTLDRGAQHKGSLTSAPGYETIPVPRVLSKTASFTLTKADSGAVIYADSTTSVVVTLPATKKGLVYTLVVNQLTTSGGHAFSPAAADKIMGPGLTAADNKDLICSAATDALGNQVTLVGDGVNGWYVYNTIGTWAREA